MSEEWDEVNNDPEESETEDRRLGGFERSPYADAAMPWPTGGTINFFSEDDIIRSGELIRISSVQDYDCSRHGRANSFSIQARTETEGPPRVVQTCIHCFMDMLVNRCGSLDNDPDRILGPDRDRMLRNVMANVPANDRLRPRMDTHE